MAWNVEDISRENTLFMALVPLHRSKLKAFGFDEEIGSRIRSPSPVCGLFHIAYPSVPEVLKIELRSIYNQLCQDDMLMARRSAASNLGKFATTVKYTHLKTKIMTIFEDLT